MSANDSSIDSGDAVGDGPDHDADPTDAFAVLGNEVRMTALRALLDAEREAPRGENEDGALTFSELFEATSADETAGFAYHLRQLTDRFCRQTDDERYVLTYAGREIARAIRAGTYTDSVDVDPIAVDDPCPFCGATDLVARGTDNYVAIGCHACGQPTLTLPFPPGGHRGHARENLLEAFDRHHRHRLALLSDGVCPECSAPAEARVGYHDGVDRDGDMPGHGSGGVDRDAVDLPDRDVDDVPDGATADSPDGVTADLPDGRPQVAFDCDHCGCRLRSPVTLAVLEHPAVVAFYHRHGVDVRERPLWNVGEEWGERVVSEDPWCVRVSTRLDGDVLSLFVAENLDVVETRESSVTAS